MERRHTEFDARDAALLARLGAQFDENPDAFIEASKRPTAKDFQLIGTFVQVYCFAELSARQIIEMIDSVIPNQGKEAASRLAGHDVFPHLILAANRFKNSSKGNVKETLIRAAGIVGMHRQMRHTFAHWTVRRVEGDKAFLLLSKNAQEGKKRTGTMPMVGCMNYGIVAKETLRRELRKLEEHTQNLSIVAAHMSKDSVTLARMVHASI